MLTISVLFVAQGLLQDAPDGELARLTALLAAICVADYRAGMWLWRRPTRRRLMVATLVCMGLFAAFAFGVRWRVPAGPARDWLIYTGAGACSLSAIAFWFVTVYRAQQIEARLRELDERDRAIALARQLATAQIQPHFLFNSLASLQHWVDTRDDRAGPMLASLTGYLRATLPLFERHALTLGEELEAVRRYLEVMQARLGARLRFTIDAEPATLAIALPPGVLLTLVENAVEHGVSPQLAGGLVRVSACVASDGVLCLEVVDDGPGLPPGGAVGGPGHVGLANTRARLAQAFGEQASLTLANAPDGGCSATLRLPVVPSPSTTIPTPP
jgi:LytS/YehU family sensor histidine kinase